MKKNKTSKDWLRKKHKDIFFQKSRIQGYRSRSAFKLIEMDEKFKIFYKNINLLDLGSCPGGWSQVAAKKIKNGKILAIDIKSMENIQGVDFLKFDIYDKNIYEKIFSYFNTKVDVVISDMAVNTSGNKDLDSYKTGELCLNALDLSKKILNNNGVFLCKLFMGSVFNEINEKANKCFKKVVKYKPKSSRKESKEIYIYCKGFQNTLII